MRFSGKQDGPTWPYSGSLDHYMSNLRANKVIQGGFHKDDPAAIGGNFTDVSNTTDAKRKRQNDLLYWLPNIAPLGNVSTQATIPSSNTGIELMSP